ncbi:hypothetical protein ACF09H_41705 [Streptomyces sp. NPDC014983]|uniref:hypothetical protein n=1 Tax=Streptomyces sp. NPDC014983 TaxID=3364933 RepID=UPI0036F5D4C0
MRSAVPWQEGIAMNFGCGKIHCTAAGVEDLFPWFAIMFAILIAALVIMLLKTRHR